MKLKNIFLHYHMLWRLLITIVIFICLPVIVINWYTVSVSYDAIERQSMNMQLENVETFAVFFQSQLDEMLATSINISINKPVTQESIEKYRLYTLTASEELNNYKKGILIINDCYIAFKDKDYIVGTQYIYERALFANYFAINDDGFTNRFNEIVENLKGGTEFHLITSPVNSTYNGMLVFMPLSIRSKNDAVIIYHINYSSLNSAFFGQSKSETSQLYLFGDDGEMLLSNQASADPIVYRQDFHDFITATSLSSNEIDYDGETFCVFRKHDPQLSLSFVIIIPRNEITQAVGRLSGTLRYTKYITIALLIIMLATVVYINYKPIGDISKKLFPDRKHHPPVGELESFMHVLDDTINEKTKISSVVTERTMWLTEHVLQELLDGKNIPEDELNVIGIKPEYTCFCVMTAMGVSLDIDSQDQLCRELRRPGSHTLFVTQSIYESRSIFIFAATSSDNDLRRRLAGRLYDMLLEIACDGKFKLGIGTFERAPEKLRNSYLCSVIASDQGEYGNTSYYEDTIRNFSTIQHYPSENILRFMQLIKQGSYEQAVAELDALAEYIRRNITTQMLEKYICYDIIHLFIKTVSQMNITLSSDSIDRLMMFNHIGELYRHLKDLVSVICQNVEQDKLHSAKDFREMIIGYLEKEYCNPDINNTMIANHFGVSVSTFSHFFNSHMGMTIREYIIQMRVKRAKHLLASTDENISNIASSVGFRNVSYFIHSFKKAANVTPNQYRKTLVKNAARN